MPKDHRTRRTRQQDVECGINAVRMPIISRPLFNAVVQSPFAQRGYGSLATVWILRAITEVAASHCRHWPSNMIAVKVVVCFCFRTCAVARCCSNDPAHDPAHLLPTSSRHRHVPGYICRFQYSWCLTESRRLASCRPAAVEDHRRSALHLCPPQRRVYTIIGSSPEILFSGRAGFCHGR